MFRVSVPPTCWRERGQVTPLLALLAVIAGLACLGLGRFGAGVADAARAQTAADLTALAAVSGDDDVVRNVATRNDAVLVSIERAGGDVRVRVRVGTSEASARARSSSS